MEKVTEYYEKYGPMVYRRCLYLLRDDDLAYDALQDVFVQLLKKKDMKIIYPSALLQKIATNICLNKIRSRKKLIISTEMSERGVDKSNLERDAIINDLLERLFAGEKPETFSIAVMHYLDRMTLEQVAQEVNLSRSGVRKRLAKIKRKLQAEQGELHVI